jgi:hypothetical protein
MSRPSQMAESQIADAEVELNPIEARALTDQIKTGVEAVWQLVTQAYTERAWAALGYRSWDDYLVIEFGRSRLQLPREDRAEVVSSMRESGLSERAIAAATGLGRTTVQRELAGGPNGPRDAKPIDVKVDEDALAAELIAAEPLGGLTDETPGQTGRVTVALERARTSLAPVPDQPAPVIGMDGKTYQPKPPRLRELPKRRRGPITDTARSVGLELGKNNKRVVKLLDDDRFDRNREVIGNRIRPEVAHSLDALQRLHIEINKGKPAALLPAIAKAMINVVTTCQSVEPGEVPDPAGHVELIRGHLQVIHDLINQWEVK